MGDANNSLHLSAITVTEIHRLARKGKISIHTPNGLEEWFHKGLPMNPPKDWGKTKMVPFLCPPQIFGCFPFVVQGFKARNGFRGNLTQHRVTCEPITLAIAHAAEVLPAIHNDPADRFILATAKVLGGRILSPDRIMPKYPGIATEW